MAFITANVVDDQGIIQPSAADMITFKVSGPGVIAATDNGDLTDHEPFDQPQHHAYHGQCIAIIRATASSGSINIIASAKDLAGASTTITAESTQ